MKRLVVALALLSLAGAARADDAAAVYAKRCASCHGKDGKGSPVGQKLGAQDLTATKLSEKQLEETIENGRGKMAAYKGKLSEDEIKSLAHFIKGGLK
jgi:cytochrome c6